MVVISISIDQGRHENLRKLMKDYANRKKLTFLNLLDPKSEVAIQYGVRGVPMTFFINTEGMLTAYASGYRKWDSKEGMKMFEQLLTEKTYK